MYTHRQDIADKIRKLNIPHELVEEIVDEALLQENRRCVAWLLHESNAALKLGLTECASILDTLAVRMQYRDDPGKGA